MFSMKFNGDSSCGTLLNDRRERLVILDETLEIGTQGREIILPVQDAGARRKLGIALADSLFEKHTHAGHDLEVADTGSSDAVADGIGFGAQTLEDVEHL